MSRIDCPCSQVKQIPDRGKNSKETFRDEGIGSGLGGHAFQLGEQEHRDHLHKKKYVALGRSVKPREDRLDAGVVKPRPSSST
jgi:hypothetical protein